MATSFQQLDFKIHLLEPALTGNGCGHGEQVLIKEVGRQGRRRSKLTPVSSIKCCQFLNTSASAELFRNMASHGCFQDDGFRKHMLHSRSGCKTENSRRSCCSNHRNSITVKTFALQFGGTETRDLASSAGSFLLSTKRNAQDNRSNTLGKRKLIAAGWHQSYSAGCRRSVFRAAANGKAGKLPVAVNSSMPSSSLQAQTAVDVQDKADSGNSNDEKPEAYVILSSGSFARSIILRRIAVWSTVALAVYQLRDFIGIFMGTFVLSVVGNSMVARVQQTLPAFARKRRLIVAAMYVLTVAAVVALGFIYLPGITQEAAEIVYKVQRNEDPYRIISDRLRLVLGEKSTDQLERFLLMAVSQADTELLDMTMTGNRAQRSQALQAVLKKYSGQLMSYLATAVTATSRFALQSVVSLIFSFMIVWDFGTIQRGLHSLCNSRLSVFYEEIAPAVATFARIFGRALQAQSAIALTNTMLTAIGMLVFNIKGLGPLSLVVFLCSFVPVAGVILSTVPISLMALVDGGVVKVGFVLVMVVLIHAVEAYILNPAIYSVHLKLHPIMALGVIVFAEHALGVWGLLVAVPLAVFCIEHLIMRKPVTIEELPVNA